jgi:hypothetical protein
MDVILVVDHPNDNEQSYSHTGFYAKFSIKSSATRIDRKETEIVEPHEPHAELSGDSQEIQDDTLIYSLEGSNTVINSYGIGIETKPHIDTTEYQMQGVPNSLGFIDIICNNQPVNVTAFVGQNNLMYFLDLDDGYCSTNPSDKQLKEFRLRYKMNSIVCRHKATGKVRAFSIWKYDYLDKLVVMDIDGTVTKSNITGYWQTVFMGVYSYVHEGVVVFLDTLVKTHKLNVVYVTSRPITHQQETKNLLEGIQAVDGYEMPMGPLFMNRESISMAIYREVIANTAMEFKSGVMQSITHTFHQAGSTFRCPFALGVGNKESDAIAYNSAGLSMETILIINKQSQIMVWKDGCSPFQQRPQSEIEEESDLPPSPTPLLPPLPSLLSLPSQGHKSQEAKREEAWLQQSSKDFFRQSTKDKSATTGGGGDKTGGGEDGGGKREGTDSGPFKRGIIRTLSSLPTACFCFDTYKDPTLFQYVATIKDINFQ